MQCRYFVAALAAALSAPVLADIGVSVRIGQPGYYGRIDIGGYPSPVLIHPEPILIAPPPGGVARGPIFLRVPPVQVHEWSRHCYRYNACGRPVYFVQDDWYTDVYAPRYQSLHPPPPRYAPPPPPPRYVPPPAPNDQRYRPYDDPRYPPGYHGMPPRGEMPPGRDTPAPGIPQLYGPGGGRGAWRN